MRAVVEGREVRLPDFLIVGTARSGTTSLHDYLRQHPRIFMPDVKEPNFFAFAGDPREDDMVWDFDDYLRLFDPAEEGQVLGEASTFYLPFHQESIENMKSYVPRWEKMRIVIMLRNPVDRAFSQYMLHRMAGGQDRAFEEVVEEFRKRPESMSGPERQYFSFSFYHDDVKAYLETFPRVSVYLYKDLKADAAGLVEDLYGFLGVDESFAPKMDVKHSSGTPRSRLLDRLLRTKGFISSKLPLLKLIPLDARVRLTDRLLKLNLEKRDGVNVETRRYLKKLYREDVLRLQDLIDKDLTVWL